MYKVTTTLEYYNSYDDVTTTEWITTETDKDKIKKDIKKLWAKEFGHLGKKWTEEVLAGNHSDRLFIRIKKIPKREKYFFLSSIDE